jgi:hypothetical protein
MIELISDHLDRAKRRLRQQYKRKLNVEGILIALTQGLQELEEVIYGMATNRSLYEAQGFQLDLLGGLLDTERGGLSDTLFRIKLLAKIGQNVSQGTGEDIINVFKLLMRSRYIQLDELYPAAINLTAVGSDPVGEIDDIKAAVEQTTAAGVNINIYTVTGDNPFVFLEDTDPNGRGFGTLDDLSVGGEFATII